MAFFITILLEVYIHLFHLLYLGISSPGQTLVSLPILQLSELDHTTCLDLYQFVNNHLKLFSSLCLLYLKPEALDLYFKGKFTKHSIF